MFLGHFNTCRFHDRRRDIADVVILIANFALRLYSIRPVHNEVVGLPAAMLALLEVTERRVARHRPTGMVVRVGILAAPVLLGAQVSFHRCLQTVQYIGFVEGAGEAAFAGCTVVSGHKDQVLSSSPMRSSSATTRPICRSTHSICPANTSICRAYRDFSSSLKESQAGNCVDAFGQFRIRWDDSQCFLTFENFLAGLVPAHVELALVFVDVAVGCMVRGVHRARCPQHHERQVRLDGLVTRDPLDCTIGQILVEMHGLCDTAQACDRST